VQWHRAYFVLTDLGVGLLRRARLLRVGAADPPGLAQPQDPLVLADCRKSKIASINEHRASDSGDRICTNVNWAWLMRF
jgi:hypothetical protein